jgi:hypothetical protein
MVCKFTINNLLKTFLLTQIAMTWHEKPKCRDSFLFLAQLIRILLEQMMINEDFVKLLPQLLTQ